MTVSIIAAVAANGVIGRDQGLAWNLPDDMAWFKRATLGHVVIMGRKNYESIPQKYRPLKGRTNIILSRQTNLTYLGAKLVHSLAEALEAARGEQEVFIIGGGEVYRQALKENVVDRMYLTELTKAYQGDTYFPSFEPRKWQRKLLSKHAEDEQHASAFEIVQYDRI